MPLGYLRLFIVGVLSFGALSCGKSNEPSGEALLSKSTSVTTCKVTRTVKLGITGGYGINGTATHGDNTTTPVVYLDAVVAPGTPPVFPTHTAIPSRFPALSRPPGEFCTSERGTGEETVRCLNDKGTPVVVPLPLDEMAKRLSVPRQCMRIQDDIGMRPLEELSRQWLSVLSGCAEESKKQKVKVLMTFERSEGTSGCADSAAPICALVRLSIPAIGFKRRLGHIWNFPMCTATRTVDPDGIQVCCSNNDISYAEVYRYPNTVFYRVEETELARYGVGQAMQSVKLPCGMEPDFQFRSYIPIEQGTSN